MEDKVNEIDEIFLRGYRLMDKFTVRLWISGVDSEKTRKISTSCKQVIHNI